MIGRLKGVLVIKRPPQLLIECQGVGYEVDVSMSTFYQLPNEGDTVVIWTHLLIKDDQHLLVGFYTQQERSLFRQLIKVNGVGAKMALTILSGISEADFKTCIHSSDVATLTRLPGVGKKTAERLIIEMRDKLDSQSVSELAVSAAGVPDGNKGALQNEAIEALKSLGYKPADATKMIATAMASGVHQSAENLIKQALQNAIR